jgi:manganese transport protein
MTHQVFLINYTSALGFEPLQVLLVAQALNGIILPIVAILIFIIINKKNLMGHYDLKRFKA